MSILGLVSTVYRRDSFEDAERHRGPSWVGGLVTSALKVGPACLKLTAHAPPFLRKLNRPCTD